MKYYLILTNLIRNIGGGHIYSVNKMEYVHGLSYKTGFFHADVRAGQIVIEKLRPYESMCDWHLQYPCYFFNTKEQCRVVRKICDIFELEKYDDIIIESQTITTSTWGELLAKRLKAKHFVYLLSEHLKIENKNLCDFFEFKLRRKELVGIAPQSISKLFAGWEVDGISESNYLFAYCTNVVKKIDNPVVDIDLFKSDYIIGSIGRIDKAFVETLIKSTIALADQYKEKTFTILLIGGASSNRPAKRIKRIVKYIPNIKLYITGLIYPIPEYLIKIADIFVSTAGGAQLSYSLGKPTIAIDANDLKPIGVLGETTNNSIFREDEPKEELNNLMERMLVKRELIDIVLTPDKKYQERYSYDDHLSCVANSEKNKNYFDISFAKLSIKEKANRLILKFYGHKFYGLFLRLISPYWMKVKLKL